MDIFTFGDPAPILQSTDWLSYFHCAEQDRWFEPPISWEGIAKTYAVGPHHGSALRFKRNQLVSSFIAHPLLSRCAFRRFAQDFLIFGNAYLEKQINRLGQLQRLEPILAKYMRRGRDLQSWYFVHGIEAHQFPADHIVHVYEPDIHQEIYGLPDYLGALHSAWLNESATLFRRKYYENGSHAGFILYMTDPAQQEADIDALRQALKDSKGPGNFRNLFMYAPNGKKDGIQLIPVSEVHARDEFFNIKNITRDDILVAHRVPPHLLAIVPHNTGGFGNVKDAATVFFEHEIRPLQEDLKGVNAIIGEEVFRFKTGLHDSDTSPMD